MSLPKSVICKHWANGWCKNDALTCSFAHGQDDLINTNVASYAIARERIVDVKNLCHNILATGTCPFGDNCKYPHHVDQLIEKRVPAQKAPMDPSKFRTKVCRHWENGHCTRGKTCNFLHKYEVNSFKDFPTLEILKTVQQVVEVKLVPKTETEIKTKTKPKTELKTKPKTELETANYWNLLETV